MQRPMYQDPCINAAKTIHDYIKNHAESCFKVSDILEHKLTFPSYALFVTDQLTINFTPVDPVISLAGEAAIFQAIPLP